MTSTIDDSGGNAQNISDDVTNVSLETSRALQDITGLTDTEHERLALLGDGQATVNGVFDDATNMAHAVFKNVATNTNTRTSAFAISGQTLTLELLYTSYGLSRGAGGELTFAAPGQLANGTSFGWS